jgi:hypothetical protein
MSSTIWLQYDSNFKIKNGFLKLIETRVNTKRKGVDNSFFG